MFSLRSVKTLCVVVLLCAAAAISAPAQTLNSLVSFDNYDGALPYAGVAQGLDGNYYGTTYAGGDTGYQGGDDCNSRCGVVYKINAAGTLTDVYKFCSQAACADGYGPNGGLVLDSNDNFYGTTSYGGANGDGTVFQLSPTGTLKTIYSFNGTDGAFPFSALVQGPDGDLYGTTQSGGANNSGVVYKITTAGTLTLLHSFCSGCSDLPSSQQLTLAADGNFYGTAGASIFKITTAGVYNVLYTFSGTTIAVSLLQAADGTFYGDTSGNGSSSNGTFFSYVPGGTPTILHNFNGSDGVGSAMLTLGSDGNFYGLGGGTFQITPAGVSTPYGLPTTGTLPLDALFQATNGIFYGTTYYGGTYERCNSNACGTVFSLSMGLAPIVTAVPTVGPVGRNMYILGSDLTGTTSVTFNGVSATFTVLSPTAIRTQVPTGATTGSIEVVTPSGTLKSGVAFDVL